MKVIIFAVIFLAISCGKYKVGGDGSQVGQLKTFNPTALSSADREQLTLVCDALYADTSTLEGSTHSFNAIQNDCGRPVTAVEDAPVIQTEIQGGRFKNKATGLDFLFPTFDTKTSGLLADICSNLANVTSPRLLPSGDAQWVSSLGISRENCSAQNGEICLQFDTGTLQNGNYLVHTSEFVRFRTDANFSKRGFASFHKKVSRSYCSDEETVTSQAQLK